MKHPINQSSGWPAGGMNTGQQLPRLRGLVLASVPASWLASPTLLSLGPGPGLSVTQTLQRHLACSQVTRGWVHLWPPLRVPLSLVFNVASESKGLGRASDLHTSPVPGGQARPLPVSCTEGHSLDPARCREGISQDKGTGISEPQVLEVSIISFHRIN